MALTLLRHGPLLQYYHKRYIGWSDIGIHDTLFDISKVHNIMTTQYDQAYSSTLLRCTQTLDKIGIPYRKDDRLKELRFKKKIELLCFEDVQKLPCFCQDYLQSKHSWLQYIASESYEEFEKRVRSFLSILDPSKEILICSHKGTLNMILEVLDEEYVDFDYLQSHIVQMDAK